MKEDKRAGKGWSKGMRFAERKKCEHCGAEFYCAPCVEKRSENSGKYCSYACRGMATKKKKQEYKKLCSYCFVEYFAKKKLQKYCSARCTSFSMKKEKIKACETCGEKFKTVIKKYCSVKCAALSRSGEKNHNWIGRPDSVCSACGKKYRPRPGDRGLVCSMKCWGQIKTKHVEGKPHPTGKGGKREDLGGLYVRSRWEANWARYLNFLKKHGAIKAWQYEPDTFYFDVKRGSRFYTPDFKIFENDGSIVYHEVKGYLDKASQTKIKRMQKYYPDMKVVLIMKKEIGEAARKVAALIPEWEYDNKKGRYG